MGDRIVQRLRDRQAALDRERRQLQREQRRLIRRIDRLSSSLWKTARLRTTLRWIKRELRVDLSPFARLEIEDWADVVPRAWAKAHLEHDPFYHGHRFWKVKRVKEAAYTILGRRRLMRKDRTPEMALTLLMDLSRDPTVAVQGGVVLGSYFYGILCSDGHIFEAFSEELMRTAAEAQYQKYTKQRILLAGWRQRDRWARLGLKN